MKTFYVFFLLLFFATFSKGQDKFSINGQTSILSNGKITIWKIGNEDIYSVNFNLDTVNIIDYKFIFSGTIDFPQNFRFFIIGEDDHFISESFYIDSGSQELKIDSFSSSYDFKFNGYKVTSNSESDKEFKNSFLPLFDSTLIRINNLFKKIADCDSSGQLKKDCESQIIVERKEIRNNRDSILLSYALHNPRSQIINAQLAQSIWDYGYKEPYKKIYEVIKDYNPIYISTILSDYLERQKLKAIGSHFPLISFLNDNIDNYNIKNNKYTLIEFWYSGCRPCISNFIELRKIYDKYKGKKFEIVAISIDSEETLPAYYKVLQKYHYPWKLILDKDGKVTSSIEINKFPTSFLLDGEGKIIEVDISPVMLEHLLSTYFE